MTLILQYVRKKITISKTLELLKLEKYAYKKLNKNFLRDELSVKTSNYKFSLYPELLYDIKFC